MTVKQDVWLVRHGQTPANEAKVWHGQIDTPLTELGHQQRQMLGSHFSNYVTPDVIFSSTLQRARLTAESIAEQFDLEVQQQAELMEFTIGDWEGKSYEELFGELDFFNRMQNEEEFSAPGGESRGDVTRRFCAAVERIAEQNTGKNIVIVAHGMAIGFALAHWLHGDSARWQEYSSNNTGVSRVELNPTSLLKFNLCEHLPSN